MGPKDTKVLSHHPRCATDSGEWPVVCRCSDGGQSWLCKVKYQPMLESCHVFVRCEETFTFSVFSCTEAAHAYGHTTERMCGLHGIC